MKKIVAIPSYGPNLTDSISEHFGHCNYFVGIEIDENNNYKKIFSLQNQGHSGCMEPVINMKERNVIEMVVDDLVPIDKSVDLRVNFKGLLTCLDKKAHEAQTDTMFILKILSKNFPCRYNIAPFNFIDCSQMGGVLF